jgi:hypothetical protein
MRGPTQQLENFALHPLIHSHLEFSLAQDIGRQASTKKPPSTGAPLADGGLKARFKTAPRASVDKTSSFYSMLYALCFPKSAICNQRIQ